MKNRKLIVSIERYLGNYQVGRYPNWTKGEIGDVNRIGILRWNDVSRTSRIFSSQIATFPRFQVYLNVTQAKQMISLLILIISVIPTSSKGKRRIIVYDTVTRYGPRTSSQRKGLTSKKVIFFSVSTIFR